MTQFRPQTSLFKIFRCTGWFEGTSLLVLFLFAMPMKYLAHEPIYVRVVGSLHGALFLLYLFSGTLLSRAQAWKKRKLFLAYLCSTLPFGTFYFEKKWLLAHD